VHKIAHIIMKNSVMISKFTISGTEFISEVIASFRLLFLEISLNGLRILSKRRAFRNEISYYEKAIKYVPTVFYIGTTATSYEAQSSNLRAHFDNEDSSHNVVTVFKEYDFSAFRVVKRCVNC
jgi:hypothetical protein